MSWKFKVSKYKNASPKYPKREETIQDVTVGSLMQTCGNYVAASCTYMAFNITTGGGGNLGILPLDTTGRIGQSLPTLKSHGDTVSDMMFSPFHDDILATCSADCTVKVWKLPEVERLSESIDTLSPCTSLPAQQHRVENVAWNPVADNILVASTAKTLKLFDVETAVEKYVVDVHNDQIQSVCWCSDGTLVATTCKDKKLRTLDLRSSSLAQECDGHQNNKDSRVVWMADKDFLLTSGFNKSRDRELKIWDCRNLKSALKSESLGSSTGILMPLLDEDTNMLLLVGKGDSRWSYFEVSTAEPYFTQNSQEQVERNEQIKGACLVPKRAVDVMSGELDRLLVLIQNTILPLPYIAPRKNYKDFHGDLFPDTRCGEAALTSQQWCSGQNAQVALMSLDPSKRSQQRNVVAKDKVQKETSISNYTSNKPKPESTNTTQSSSVANVSNTTSKANTNSSRSSTTATVTPDPPTVVAPREPSKAAKSFQALHQSKCKYLKGVIEHPSTHIVNIRRLCRTLPGQSNLFATNNKRCAIPIEGSGGLVAVFELDKPCRLPDAGVPVLQNGSKVNDFVFDPFDDSRILIGCDNAKVYIWKIPDNGITETLTEWESYLMSHTEKIYFVRFHPLAKDVVMTASYDMTIKLWDLTDNTEKIELISHTDEIFCGEWSTDGRLIATVCKDGKVRIFDPRKSTAPIKEGVGPEGSRGARVVWAINMKYLFISAFNKTSVRCLYLYSVDTLELLHTVELAVSPALLIPHYDVGTSTVLLTGRGDRSILSYEISDEYPHLYPLASILPESSHQAIDLQCKVTCDVKKIEIARLWRLTQTTIEPISVTVPRVKPEYFQDDLYPDTIQPGVASLTSTQWYSGQDKQPINISLRPTGMKLLSEAPVEAPKAKKYESFSADTYKTDEMKKDELINAVTNKLGTNDQPLPQDTAEGVDSDEWGDD